MPCEFAIDAAAADIGLPVQRGLLHSSSYSSSEHRSNDDPTTHAPSRPSLGSCDSQPGTLPAYTAGCGRRGSPAGEVPVMATRMQLTAVYELVEDGWTQARLAELPAVITAAPTRQEARELLVDAL